MAKSKSTAGNGRTGGRAAPDPWPYARWPDMVADWDDPRQFWSVTLAKVHHLRNLARSQPGRPGRAKHFWELLESCAMLKGLWDHRPVDEVHAAVLALADVQYRGLVERDHSRRPGPITDKQERRYWAKWAKWFQQTVEVLQELPKKLIPTAERDRMLPIFTQAASQAAAWAKDLPPDGSVRILQIDPDGKERILEIPSGERVKRNRGRPENHGDAIAGELSALHTFLQPIIGRKWTTFMEIVRHFSGPEPQHIPLSPEALRVRIAQVRRSHPEYVSSCEHHVRSLVSERAIDPLDTAF